MVGHRIGDGPNLHCNCNVELICVAILVLVKERVIASAALDIFDEESGVSGPIASLQPSRVKAIRENSNDLSLSDLTSPQI